MISDIVQGTVTKWTLITDKIFGFPNWYRGNNTECQSLNNYIGYVSCVLCGVEGRISRYQKPTSSVVTKISVSEWVAKTVTLGFVTVNKATSSELSWISMNTGAIPNRLSSEGRGGHERTVYVVVTYICVIPETRRRIFFLEGCRRIFFLHSVSGGWDR